LRIHKNPATHFGSDVSDLIPRVPLLPSNLGRRLQLQWSAFNEGHIDPYTGVVNLVHEPVDLFHAFFFRKIILKNRENPWCPVIL
jgi:hypothetical protein